MQTHRGRMLVESLEGAYDSAGLGNGLSTFRIRPSNEGSRTETHNDFALLLYEQGIIGFGLITYLILWRIYLSVQLAKSLNNRYVETSLDITHWFNGELTVYKYYSNFYLLDFDCP